MKKSTILLSLVILLALPGSAQMVHEQTYNSTKNTVLVDLAISGKKYAVVDGDNDEARLYNLDHTLWKTINFPLIPGFNAIEAFYFSENLFKLDNKVDVAVLYGGIMINFGKCVVIDEDGNVINQVDNASYMTVYNSGNDNFKAIIAGNNEYFVYSLPGTIPCNSCNGLGLGKAPNAQNVGYISDPIPNPSSNNTLIDYVLPVGIEVGNIIFYNSNGQVVKNYAVDNSNKQLTINSSDVPSGSYYYNLNAGGTQSQTMKMIIIK